MRRDEHDLGTAASRSAGAALASRWRLECGRDGSAEDTGPRRKRAEGQVLRAAFDGLNVAHRNAEIVGQRLLGQAASVAQLGQAPTDVLEQSVGIYGAHKPTLAARAGR